MLDNENTEQLDISEIQEEKKDNSRNKLIIVAIGLCVIALVVVLILLFSNLTKKEEKNEATPEATETPTSEVKEEDVLGYYAMQKANTAIQTQLNETYGNDGYIKPDTSEYTVSGTETNATIKFQLHVKKDSEAYVVPASFTLKWNADDEVYEITDYSIDDSKAEKSNFKEHSDDKEKEEQAQTAAKGELTKSYTINVSNSVTVEITSTSDSTVSVYAVDEDGKSTEIASATNETTSKTVSLPAGQYELQLYTEQGSGYKFSYSFN